MLPEYTLQEAARLLGVAMRPAQVILFGSSVRSDADDVLDADFLVIESEVHDPGAEMVRLSQVLQPSGIATDVLVHSMSEVDKRRDLCSGAVHWAKREGKVLYAAT